jgi:hypothetical protein
LGRARRRAISKPNPNPAESTQIQQKPGKEYQRKSLGLPWIPLSELSLFNGLR